MDNPDIIQGSYNSETDPASVSVTEAKKLLLKNSKMILKLLQLCLEEHFHPMLVLADTFLY